MVVAPVGPLAGDVGAHGGFSTSSSVNLPRRAGRPTLGEMPDRLASRTLDEPHPSRLTPDAPRRDEILAAHRRAVAAGDDGYVDPVTGLFVFTAAYLAERGTCCESRCRHCPYVE